MGSLECRRVTKLKLAGGKASKVSEEAIEDDWTGPECHRAMKGYWTGTTKFFLKEKAPDATLQEMALEAAPATGLSTRLEEFWQMLHGLPEDAVCFRSEQSLRQWAAEGYVDFLEIFCGCQTLTFAVRDERCTAGDGLDRGVISYNQAWPLHDPATRRKAAWLICKGLKPRATHTGTPCTRLGVLGQGDGQADGRQAEEGGRGPEQRRAHAFDEP